MNKTLFTNVNLFDGFHDQIQSSSWMLVNKETGKFEAFGSEKNYPPADKTIDLEGQYVMPGLVNCHTHVTLNANSLDSGSVVDQAETTVRAVQNLHDLLKSGVTYIRECGSTYGLDTSLARMQRSGVLKRVPTIMASGLPMTMTGGHADFLHGGQLVDSPDEMRKAVRNNFKNGAQCTKVMATGGVMSPGDYMTEPQLTVDELSVAVYETHAKHAIIAAHAEGNPGIMHALNSKT